MKTKIFLGILILILILLLRSSLNKSDRLSENLESLRLNTLLQNQKVDSLVNENGYLIFRQKVIEIENQSVIKKYTDSIFEMSKKYEKSIKATIAYYSSINNTKIEKEYIPYDTSYNDYFPPTNNSDSLISYIKDSTVKIGTKIDYQDSDKFSLLSTLGRKGLENTSINIPDSFYLKIDLIKGGLFKKDYYNILSYHTNPLIQNKGQNSLIYKPKKKHFVLKSAMLIFIAFLIGKSL